MNEIEYVFGTGDGTVHVWASEADLDLADTGTTDAVQLDFDGDGLADDALWDATGAGVADIAALDLDDDGVLDHFYTDPTGLGTWEHRITGAAADAAAEPLGWIVRTGPFPDTSPESNNMVAEGITEVLAEYPLAQPDTAGRDADDLLEHTGVTVTDRRGRILEGDTEPGAEPAGSADPDIPFGR
ncbi:hypothetical protein [Nocardia sp. NPDC005366]|uniref:hypothetical protein n=1 Tax=Nocardia sp. NPDC005366 TaxID=3156878 RepID=UPI0033BDA1F4